MAVLQLEQIYAPVADDMDAVNGVIRRQLHSDIALIRQIAEYIIGAGGKRMRPALLLLVANALGYRGTSHRDLAAVIEFIHTATLLHDDVVDESDLRRGCDTANAMFGNAAAVLVGDFLHTRAFQMMVAAGNLGVMQVVADATNVIAEGEVLQLLNVHNAEITQEAYLRVIHYKTAMLFEAAVRVGAILGGASEALQEQLAAFARHLGTAFQLIDDVLDYSGDEETTGKHLGDDLAEGKPTLPLILVMQQGSPAQAEVVRRAIVEGGRDAFPGVIEAVRAVGALEATRALARSESGQAAALLSVVPASIFKESLLELCSFAVGRQH